MTNGYLCIWLMAISAYDQYSTAVPTFFLHCSGSSDTEFQSAEQNDSDEDFEACMLQL